MGTVIGAVIDYLVAGLPAPLSAIAADVVVADNEPGLTSESLIVIGRAAPDSGTAAGGQDDYRILGARRLSEDWTLDGYIHCLRDGPAQKPARDAAIGLYDGLISFLQSDLTLGGLLTFGRYARAGGVQLTQTQDDEDTGASGAQRMAMISFELVIPNTYIPG